MASFKPDPSKYRSLGGKVIVLTGGANGIGAATIELFAQHGAAIVFGDLDSNSGEKLASQHDSKRVQFRKTDVTKYEDNVALFQKGWDSYGRIDHALSIAGIVEQGNIFDPAISLKDVAKPPTNAVLDTNLLGPMYFARIAAAYLNHGRKPEDDKSIILFSSVAGFVGSPGLFAYSASKHGVLGLLRSLRQYLPAFGIRINAVAPLATATDMLPSAVQKGFKDNIFPLNTPQDIARVVLGLVAGSYKLEGNVAAALGQDKEDDRPNGLSLYVEGGKAWDIEEGLKITRPQWLGERPNDVKNNVTAWLASGAAWTSGQ